MIKEYTEFPLKALFRCMLTTLILIHSLAVGAVDLDEMTGRWESFGSIENSHYYQSFVINEDQTGRFLAFLGGPSEFLFSSKDVVARRGYIELTKVFSDGVKWVLILSLLNSGSDDKALKGTWFVYHPIAKDQYYLVNTHALNLIPENQDNLHSAIQPVRKSR